MLEAAHLGIDVAEHGVIGMTSETGMILGNPVVLKMRGWNIVGIVDVEALPTGLHDMAGKTKLRRRRVFQMNRSAQARRNNRQDKERDEGDNFAALRRRDGRAQQQ